MHQSLSAFCESKASKPHSRLATHAQKVVRSYQNAALLMQRKYAKKNQNQKIDFTDLLSASPLILPISYQGHAITFVQWGAYLAKCDRGVKKTLDTIILYEMRKGLTFTPELITELLLDNHTDKFIHTDVKKILGLHPVLTLPTHVQLVGNCSWANVEAALPAALCMMLYPQAKASASEVANLKKEIMHFYEAWVEWDKDRTLIHSIEAFSGSNKARQAAHAGILASILIQRCLPFKAREIKRARKIVPILLKKEFQYILKSYLSVYSGRRAGKLGHYFSKLLELCGVKAEVLNALEDAFSPSQIVKINLPMHLAARRNDLSSLRYYIEKLQVDVNLQDETGSTALMYAAWKGHMECVMYLVEECGAQIHTLNTQGGGAIQYAAYGKNWPIVEYLLKHHT